MRRAVVTLPSETGLKISTKKTRVVNFNKDDFDFVGYISEHRRKRKAYYIAKPKEAIDGYIH